MSGFVNRPLSLPWENPGRTIPKSVAEALVSSDFTDATKFVLKWQFGLLGDFQTALAQAIMKADDDNLARLRIGFPDQVDGFLQWNRGDLAQRLRAEGIDV
jgi:hypothetical protein